MTESLTKTIDSVVDINESDNFVSMYSPKNFKVVDSIDFENSVFNDTASTKSNYKHDNIDTRTYYGNVSTEDTNSVFNDDVSDEEINAYLGEKRRQDVPLLERCNESGEDLGDVIISHRERELASKMFYTRVVICIIITMLFLLIGCFILLLAILFR